MIQARNLGFPRMGTKRELKFALERYWSGKSGEVVLEQTAIGVAQSSLAIAG
jgi:5-methyltetrahydropteroyltriglutamate--homocysteine methyltransferase